MRMDGFLTLSTMRPKHSWAALHVSILAALLLTSNADSQDSECSPEILVRRDTVYKPWAGQSLRITCEVSFCENTPQPPPVIWHKSPTPIDFNKTPHISAHWTTYKDLEGASSLVFEHVSRNDSGMYQCVIQEQVGHHINVFVHDIEPTPLTRKNETNSTLNQDPNIMDPLLYVYPAAGILVFVIIVIIISVIAMQGCKGKPKKETQTGYQCVVIPMVQQPSLRGSPSRGSECIYAKPLSRGSTRRNAPPSQERENAASGEGARVYGKRKEEDKQRRRKAVEKEEGSPVVYAALNHQVPPGAPVRPRRPKEESSEYAAIRVS